MTVRIRKIRRLTIDELHEVFPCFAISPLRDCHNSNLIQKIQKILGSKNAHR
jgi:hypothetical protein